MCSFVPLVTQRFRSACRRCERRSYRQPNLKMSGIGTDETAPAARILCTARICCRHLAAPEGTHHGQPAAGTTHEQRERAGESFLHHKRTNGKGLEMLNRCLLIGRTGKDAELRYTTSGQAVSNFSLACEHSYKDK